jgi:hypothetical protein
MTVQYLSAKIVNGQSSSAVISIYNQNNFIGSLLNIPVSPLGIFVTPSPQNNVVNTGNSLYVIINSNVLQSANTVLVVTLGVF